MNPAAVASVRRKALVTGGATGIGRSAVLALARAGYDVAINYAHQREGGARNRAAEAEALGARTIAAAACDVSDEAAVRAMLKQVDDAFGRLDVLVNNAGTTASWKPQGPREPATRRMGPRLRRQRARPVPGDARRGAAAEERHEAPASSTPPASSACAPARSPCPTRRARRRWSTSPRRWPGTSAPRSASTPSPPAGWKATGCSAC